MHKHQSLTAEMLSSVHGEMQKRGMKMWNRFNWLRHFVNMIMIMNIQALNSKAFLD
jgi:hypothetical protein